MIQLQDFVGSMLWFRSLEARESMGLESAAHNIDEYILANGLEKDFQDFLREPSGQEFSFSKPQEGGRQLSCSIGGNLAPFNPIASAGRIP